MKHITIERKEEYVDVNMSDRNALLAFFIMIIFFFYGLVSAFIDVTTLFISLF